MKKIALLTTILFLSIALFLFSKNKGRISYFYESPFAYLGGLQIHEATQEGWVQALQANGMNTAQVTIYAEQGAWDSDSLIFDSTDVRVLDEIRTLKKAGLKAILILRVSLDHSFWQNRFRWHGMVMPKDQVTLERWFDRYREFVLHWAQIAEAEGVDVFGIGSEMNTLVSTRPIQQLPNLYAYYRDTMKQYQHEARALKFKDQFSPEDLKLRYYQSYDSLELLLQDRVRQHYDWSVQTTFMQLPIKQALKKMNARRSYCQQAWRQLIADTRKVYSGKLTYAANFDNYEDVAFWDALDFVGINAYFPLRDANRTYPDATAMQSAFETEWKAVFKSIKNFQEAQQIEEKPLLFTELGYISREYATVEPWAGFGFSIIGSGRQEQLVLWGKSPKNYMERKWAMDALYKVVEADQVPLAGLLYWKLTTHDYHLPHEPFALHVTPEGKDPLQASLAQFAKLMEENTEE